MQYFNRASLTLLAFAAICWSLLLTFVGLHFAAPSDGARVAGGNGIDGLRLAPLIDAGLQDKDVVIAIDGRSVESIVNALADLSQPAPQTTFGQAIIYTILRDGKKLDIPITLSQYPLGAIWAKDWGAIFVAIALQLTMGYVFFKRPDEPIARAMFLAAAAMVSATTWSIGLTIPDVVGKVGFWLYAVSSTGMYALVWVGALHSILLFPTPWTPLTRRRWIVPALYIAPYLAFALVTLLIPAPNALVAQQHLGQTIGFVQTVYGLAAIVAALRSFRAAHDAVSRAQVKWVGTGFVFAFFCAFTLGMLPEIVLGYPLISWSILALTGLIFPIALAVAILRYRLFDIDVILNRTLVYGTLTASTIGIYVFSVGYIGTLFQDQDRSLLAFLATGLVAVIFQPLRERLQRVVNRMMYGERDDPYAVLSRLGKRLEATLAPEAVLPTIVETVAQTLKLSCAAIALKEENGFKIVAVSPAQPQTSVLPIQAQSAAGEILPLTYQGEVVGRFIFSPRAPNEPFTVAERRLLEDIAHQAGVAVHAVRLTADLQKSRERLVTAREEERRRLRRDLHDGLGPHLASQSFKLEAARDSIRNNPDHAEVLLNDLISKTQNTISDVRRLVYALRPPALDELGLIAAVREHAAQCELNGVRITVTAPDHLPALPAAVEVATYRIVQEALTNVMRHAQARTCAVSIELKNGALSLQISDDGIGLSRDHHRGVGLNSMRERAEELGGQWVIEPAPNGGTWVKAELPFNV